MHHSHVHPSLLQTDCERDCACRQYPLCNITVTWEQLGYKAGVRAHVRDMFAEKDLGIHAGSFTAVVDVHDAAALRITPMSMLPQYRYWRPWSMAWTPESKPNAAGSAAL